MPDNDPDLDAGLVSAPLARTGDPATKIRAIASQAGISPDVADDYLKLTHIESGQNINVRPSSKGALGFGQVMPDIAGGNVRTVGGRQYNLKNPDENMEAGLRYFNEGGSDPIARRLHYFGGPGAARHYQRTGQIPNISDGNMTASQYVQATGGQQRPKPTPDPDLDAGLITADPDLQAGTPPSRSGSWFDNKFKQAKPAPTTPITTSDAAWHFGMTPYEAKRLTPKAQKVLSDAVASDQAKKAAGQSIAPPPLKYQNDMRKTAGLKPLKFNMAFDETAPASYYKDQPVPFSLGKGKPAIEIRRPFTFNQPSDEQVKAGIQQQVASEAADAQKAFAAHPQGGGIAPQIDVNAETERRFQNYQAEKAKTLDYARLGPRVGARNDPNERASVAINDLLQKYAPGIASIDTPGGIKTDVIRGAVSGLNVVPGPQAAMLNRISQPREITPEERILDPNAGSEASLRRGVGQTATAFLPFVGAGKLVSAAGVASPVLRDMLTFGIAEAGKQLSQTGKIDPESLAETILTGGAMGKVAGVNPNLKRRLVAYIVPQLAASVVKGEKPDQIVQGVITNAMFALSGGKEPKEEAATQTVPDALQGKLRGGEIDAILAAREAAVKPTTHAVDVPAMRVADTVAGASPIDLSQANYPDTKYPESLGVVGPTKPVEGVEEGVKLNRWQHRNFGLVTETADQAGVTKGRVRVIDEDGDEHIIQRSNGRGEGNQIAVPVRSKPIDARTEDEAAQAADNAPFKVVDRRAQENPPEAEPTGRLNTPPQTSREVPREPTPTVTPGTLQSQGATTEQSATTPLAVPSTEANPAEATTPQTKEGENAPVESKFTKAQQRKHAAKLESAGVEVPKESKTYTPTTNRGDIEHANAIIDKEGLDSVVERIKKGDIEEGAIRSTLTDVTQKRLIDEANKATDAAEKLRRFGQSIDIAAADLPRTTKVAQELQAMGTIDKLSPDGSIKEAQRIVSTFDPTAKLDPARAKVFVDHANELASARKEVDDLRSQLTDAQKNPIKQTKAQVRQNVTRAKTQKAVDYLTSMESEAQARLSQAFSGSTFRAGIDPAILKDLSIVGASKIARGTVDLTAWSEEMARDFGEKIKPHLDEIRRMAVSLHQEAKEKFKETKIEQQGVRATEKAGLLVTPENIAKVRQQLRDAKTRQRMAQRNLEREYRNLQDEQRSKAALIATALNRNGLLSIKGFFNIAQALTGKHLVDTASRFIASPKDITVSGALRTANKLPDAAMNFGRAFLGKDSPVMEYWGSKTSSNPKIDLAINIMSRAFGAKEAFFRTFNEESEMQRMSRLLARLDVQSGTIKRGEKSSQIERYLNEGTTPGPKAQEWINSKAKKAARYEAAQGRITDSMVDVRSEDLSKDLPKLLGVLKEQYADRQVSADPSITAKTVRRGVSAAKQVHPVTGAIAKGVEEGFVPFLTRPVRSVADWLGSYTGAKLVVGSKAGITSKGVREAGFVKGVGQTFFQGDIYKAIESKFAPHEIEELKRTLSRTTTNAGLIVLGAALAKKNLLDEDGKIHANGRVWSIGDVPFVGWSLTFGAGWQKGGPTGGLKAVAKVIEHHPLIRGMTDLSDNVGSVLKGDAKVLPATEREAGSIAGRFIPHPLPDIAETMSTKERTSKGFTGPMLYRIPYMRDKLDPRLTPMGEEIPKSRLSVIDPYRSQPDLRSQWPLSKDLEPNELQRPPVRMKDVGETDAEYLQRQKTEGPFAKQALQELANDPEYYKLTKAQQRKARVRVELEARKAAREYLPAPQRRIAQREAQQ